MKKLKRNIVLVAIILLTKGNAFGLDSLKVYVYGYSFKNETFKFYSSGKIYIKKVKKGMNAFAFFIPFDSNYIKNNNIGLGIFRKGKWGLKYRYIKLDCYFEKGKKYFILHRDFRLKNRYALNYYWTDNPFYYIGGREFWQPGEIYKIFQCDSIYDNPVKR